MIYYRCPHDPGHRAHVAAYPDHPYVSVREDVLMAGRASFFAQYVFGPDRATMLKTQLPAYATAEAAQRATRAKRLDKRLDQIETAQQALVTELETPADPGDPAAQALRERIRARYRELHTERAMLETQRDQLDTATTEVNDPTLLYKLPILGDILTGAPARLPNSSSRPSTSTPSTAKSSTRSPSTSPSPRPPRRPSPSSSPTPASPTPPRHHPPPQAPARPFPIRRTPRGDVRWRHSRRSLPPTGWGGHRERAHGGGEDIASVPYGGGEDVANGQRAGYRDLRLLRSA